MNDSEAMWHDSSTAQRYANAENATRPFAKSLMQKAKIESLDKNAHVLDLATGTGAAVAELYTAVPKEIWSHLKVLGADVNQDMLKFLSKRGECEGWTGLETAIVDGNKINLPANTYTHIFITCGIFIFPSALPNLHSLLTLGGFIGLTTWARFPWIDILHRSIAAIPAPTPYNPSAAEIENHMYSGRAWNSPTYMSEQLTSAGFEKVGVEVQKRKVKVGSPEMFVASMSFVLKLIEGAFWGGADEETRGRWVEGINGNMTKEVKQLAEQHGEIVLEFEAVVGWAWKA